MPAAVQRYLDLLGGDSPAEPVVRSLLDQTVRRLHQLCASMLYRSYPRLTRPPVNLQSDELLSAVVERLLKALREARPASVRQVEIAQHLFGWGVADFNRVYTNQTLLVNQQDSLGTARGNITLYLVQVYKSMGGGWMHFCQGHGMPETILVENPAHPSPEPQPPRK